MLETNGIAGALSRNTFYKVAISHDPTKVFLYERIAPQAKWEPTPLGSICIAGRWVKRISL